MSLLTNSKGQPLKDNQVGFRRNLIRASYSREFTAYVDGLEQWFAYLENFRHALAHRIPLYIAPFVISPESQPEFETLERQKNAALRARKIDLYNELDGRQESLGRFVPAMTHSLYAEDRRIVYFHGQMLVDWKTVAEIAERFMRQSNWPEVRSG